jgi:hypothetical protein
MGVELEEDLKRKLIELNLTAGRSAQSPQTGYIHLNYESVDRHDTIPLLENFCFALALFRSRLSDLVLEGKTLLEKLLVFEVEGNFPVYLHEYPQCKDRDFNLSLLPVFHWLLTDFRIALGELLAVRLEMLIGRILLHDYKMHAQRPLCKSSEWRLKSYTTQAPPAWTPSSPEEWAEALISCQMAHSRGIKPVGILEQALLQWHPQLSVYIGPQYHDRGEPKVTLLDLFMGHFYSLYSERALLDRRSHLLASLIQPQERSPCGPIADFSACLRVPCEVPCHAIFPASEQPYALYWGTPEKLNSFCLNCKFMHCGIERTGDTVEFTIALPPKTSLDSQDTVELAFFMNLIPDQEILIQGAKATTFQLGDSLTLLSAEMHLQLEILLEKGEGSFFGHILRSNRPTQRGKHLKYETYDWQIALRTIRRSEECTLKVRARKEITSQS